jgi:serine/threonine protein kinase
MTVADAPPGDHVYQAPEQLLDMSELGPTCDLYSLAATMYEALIGQPPFPRELPFLELVQAITSRPARPPRELNPAVPPELEALLLRALSKDPGARFQTPDEFLAALDSLPPA